MEKYMDFFKFCPQLQFSIPHNKEVSLLISLLLMYVILGNLTFE